MTILREWTGEAVRRDCASWPDAQASRWIGAHDPNLVVSSTRNRPTQYTIARVYSRYLMSCASHRLPLRLTRQGMYSFVASLGGARPSTIAGYAWAVWKVVRIVDPANPDMDWLAERALAVEGLAEQQPKRKHRALHRVDARDLLNAVVSVLEEVLDRLADDERPTWPLVQRYRDALFVLVGLLCPERRHVLATLRLCDVDLKAGNLFCDGAKTKTRREIDRPVPALLAAYLHVWVERLRTPAAPGHDRLWISKGGRPAGEAALYIAMRKLTEHLIGTALSPHLLRDLAATFVVEQIPEHAHLAQVILTHRGSRMTQRYTETASAILALRQYQRMVEDHRQAAARAVRRAHPRSRLAPARRKRRARSTSASAKRCASERRPSPQGRPDPIAVTTHGPDGRQAQARRTALELPLSQADRRAGPRPDQGRQSLPTVPAARLRHGAPRMGAGLHCHNLAKLLAHRLA